ncbi:Hsp20/alpha crystallin [Sorangium cellulosum]|uniref:Hsp20/alpha crystallin n=1 Tax=Sorangium cellulosum TaxID=56 RepID=A0A2L0F7A2_SORCE|nr:Hsp20/alpha crystallin family protein [Sorangium cellulosum]AUX47445.1 Hsp20/alpha crystallin [Sorangium cellulosum]
MLSRYAPLFAGDDLLRAMFDLSSPFGWSAPAAPVMAGPRVDVVEKDNALQLVCDLPGASPEDVEVTCEQGLLTLRAVRRVDYGEAKLHRAERARGEFTRSFRIGDGYDTGQIAATLHNGVLTVTVPKRPEATPRKIPIYFSPSAGGGATEAKQLSEASS